jgi:quercetin dioxygenase-like cupin family protein
VPPTPPSHAAPSTTDGLRERLFARVRRSVELHREFLTVRREARAWQALGHGVARRTLCVGALARVEIVRLDCGAELAWTDDSLAQELLVLAGELAFPGLDGALQTLARHDYLIRERGRAAPLRATTPAQVYLRHRLAPLERLPPLEAHWWRLAAGKPRLVRQGQRRWIANAPGVSVLQLWGDADIVSVLVRFHAGASVADHHHAVDEDCLVLEGEMFLGDILLRAGDYQLAPAGGGHFGETSDVGVLFFFHGAIDPVQKAAATPAI